MTLTQYSSGDRLSPRDVQDANFPAAPIGRRGWDKESVQAFLAEVATEMELLLTEKADLYQLAERTQNGGGNGYKPEDAHVAAVRVLTTAQQTADRYVGDAQEYSRQLAEDARRNRDAVIADAQRRTEMLLAEAHRRAGDAATAAVADSSATEQQRASEELDHLRTFSDVYRSHLRTYLETLLRGVEDWERSEQAGLIAARGSQAPA